MDAVGPISRTVEDAAITLGAIAGYDHKDPYSWNTPVPDYRLSLDGNIKGIRVGVIKEQINSHLVEPEVKETVIKATSTLSDLGASVEEISLPLTNYASLVLGIVISAEPAASHREWIQERLQDYGHDSRIGLLTGSLIPAQAYYKAQRIRSLVRQQVHEALEKYDVLVLPTAGKSAQPIADDPVITSKEAAAARLPYLLTRIFSISNAPAISVPCGFDSKGLPIGLQIGGRIGGEETVLKVAHAYEQGTDWHTMRPPTV